MADEQEFARVLSLDVRKKIYTVIEESPGLHFREIQRRCEIAVGSLQYHLDYLQKHHIIRTQSEGKFVRYYAVRGPSMHHNQNIMAFLRHVSTRKIILFLLQKRRANNETIARHIQLSPSTTSWHLDKLVEANVLMRKREGRMSFFSLVNAEEAKQLVVNYKSSFLDDAVDSFVDVIQEISSAAEEKIAAVEEPVSAEEETPKTE
ncbi:MAG: winged helix-turn-helix transcriptional regulator [Candidatus Iainarchaeum archaeon]|uniref:Winged helix-turn-helix transcriptional regulator n=1 Tax=Candidatus Iainarchaeum sp. TaxID=3101447 RepID=A0A7T9I1W2_9ARCH|nr:MAG: winged helix-turn-helix transcriptional regulator [Candidatus Diapherotrites archaeon]